MLSSAIEPKLQNVCAYVVTRYELIVTSRTFGVTFHTLHLTPSAHSRNLRSH